MTKRPHHRPLARALAGLVVAAIAIGCGSSGGADTGDPSGQGSSLTSPCGIVVVGNRTDDNYCAYVHIRNNGTTVVRHWTLDIELPAGVSIDFVDAGSYTQTGTLVHYVPDAARATLNPTVGYEVTFCNSTIPSLIAKSPIASSELCGGGAIDGGHDGDAGKPTPFDSGTPGSDSGKPGTDSGTTAVDSGTTGVDSGTKSDTGKGVDTGTTGGDSGGPTTKTALGKYVMTWYSFQDNTPVNSSLSASGRKLLPYISVAVPFRLLKAFGGKLDYGDYLYVEFLDGRTMPNGSKHSGWVQIDDFCGDSGDDSYCFQSVGGAKYPNVDLYIGDYSKSGMSTSTCSGPAGTGQELTNVSTGTPGAAWSGDYGGKALGPGKCGDLASAKSAHGSCWDYTPPASSASECASCTTSSCTSW